MSAENYNYQFVAGNLALDFVNTVAYRFHRGKTRDHLQRAEEVRRWFNQAHPPDRDALKPRLRRANVLRIREVREQLFKIFHAIANNEPIPADALRRVDKALRDCRAKKCLSVQEGAVHRGKIRWNWRQEAGGSDLVLYPILTAATDLLTSDSRGLIRQCADEGCGWLFLDRSNARKRRWCSMADCGNRNKARKHYRRNAGVE